MKELDKNPKSTPKDYIQIVAEYGIEIKEEDFKPTQGELNDDELDAVAGGGYCFCFVGGGGEADQNDSTCACIVGGSGSKLKSTGAFADDAIRCVCVAAGSGQNS